MSDFSHASITSFVIEQQYHRLFYRAGCGLCFKYGLCCIFFFAGGRFCGPASPTKLWPLKLASSLPASDRSVLPPTCCVWRWTALCWNTTQSWTRWYCEVFERDPFWPSIRSLSSTSMIWVTAKKRSVKLEASAAGRVEKTGKTWETASSIGSLMRLAVENFTWCLWDLESLGICSFMPSACLVNSMQASQQRRFSRTVDNNTSWTTECWNLLRTRQILKKNSWDSVKSRLVWLQ